MSYLTQMLGLAVQNFLSAASGIAVLIALIRGFTRRESSDDRQLLGGFHAQHPLRAAAAVIHPGDRPGRTGRRAELSRPTRRRRLVDPVVIQVPATNADGTPQLDAAGAPVMKDETVTEQTLPLGPAASQVAIKQLGTNGGGFFNVNSAHPFENPTPLANFLEVLAILLISGGALLHVRRHGQGQAPGLGGAGRDAGDLRAVADRRIRRGAGGQSALRRARRGPGGLGDCSPAATWKARRPASASRTPRCGRRPRRPRRTAPSIPCTTRSRRSAGWCRCGSCSSARSSSAAWAAASTAC